MKFRDALDAFEIVIRQKMSDEFSVAVGKGIEEKIDKVVVQSREAMIITLAECRGNNETAGFLEKLDMELPTAKPVTYPKTPVLNAEMR